MAKKFFNGLDLNSQRIQNVASPSSAADAVNKTYVDNFLQGLTWKNAVRAATTAAGTLATSFANASVIDGVTLATGDRILIKDQAAPAENGIYVVAASGAPTRATDMDVAAEFVNATVFVSEGTVNADKSFTMTANAPITVGTTGITWALQGTGGTSYTAGNGLSLASTTFSVLANGTSIDVSASGVKISTAAAGNGIAVSAGGVVSIPTGLGLTPGAGTMTIDTAVVVRKFAANIGNGSLTTIAVTHNLGTRDITYSIQDTTTFAFVDTDATATDANNLTLVFPTAPASNAYRVVVHA